LECLCIGGLFDFPRGVEFDEMGAEVEQPNSNAERIVVASLRMGIPLPRQRSGRPRTSAQNGDSNCDLRRGSATDCRRQDVLVVRSPAVVTRRGPARGRPEADSRGAAKVSETF
jgi:hypothetical protein